MALNKAFTAADLFLSDFAPFGPMPRGGRIATQLTIRFSKAKKPHCDAANGTMMRR
jgi:hypothetical protein